MQKLVHKEHVNQRGDRRSDQVLEKSKREILADLVVKKALVVWENFSSESKELEHPEDASLLRMKDDDNVFNTLFAFMAKSNDEVDDKVTLLNLKENLDIYSVMKLKKLVSIFIKFSYELTVE